MPDQIKTVTDRGQFQFLLDNFFNGHQVYIKTSSGALGLQYLGFSDGNVAFRIPHVKSFPEKQMILQLLGVNGVGASTARMMLSSLKPEEISRAISQGNSRQLETVKGIGRKTAERIVLELRDKISKQGIDINNSVTAGNTTEHDALEALLALGIARPAAEQALRKAIQQEPGTEQVQDLIKSALKNV